MVSIIVHFLLGLALHRLDHRVQPKVYAKPADGPWLSPLEFVYYAAGIASIALGYYFNIQFVLDAHGQGNLVSGPASYPEFLKGQFASPAAARATRTT